MYKNANPNFLHKLDVIHHKAIKLCTGAYPTSPTLSLLCDANEPPLSLRRLYLARRSQLRDNSYNYSSDEIQQIPQPFTPNICFSVLQTLHPNFPPWNSCPINVDLSLDSNTPLLQIQQHLEKYTNHIKFFTDGSVSQNYAGCAFLQEDSASLFTLPPEMSPLTAELFALYQTALTISRSNGSNFLVCSDSLISLKHLQSLNVPGINPYVWKILEVLQTIQNKNIVFCWIPSHVNLRPHDEVDSLAKKAARSLPCPNYPVPLQDLQNRAKKLITSDWSAQWNQTPTTNKLRTIRELATPWQSSIRKSRREEVAITRLRIGHSNLTHSYLLNKTDPPVCSSCNCRLTVAHVLVHCSGFNAQRRTLNMSGDLSCILGNDTSQIDTLIQFLKNSNLLSSI